MAGILDGRYLYLSINDIHFLMSHIHDMYIFDLPYPRYTLFVSGVHDTFKYGIHDTQFLGLASMMHKIYVTVMSLNL